VLEHDDLFPPQYALTGIETRQALQHLERHRLPVSVVAGEDRPEFPSTVVGRGDSGWNAIVLSHPAGASPEQPAFGTGEALRLLWTEDRVRYSAQARVVRVGSGDPLTYELQVGPEVLRLGRRRTLRVPIEPNDGVRAELLIDGRAEPLIPVVRDLSVDGCRLSLAAELAHGTGLGPGLQAALSLLLADGAEREHGRIQILHIGPANEGLLDFGASWLAPVPKFKDRIARFVAIKQYMLSQRVAPSPASGRPDASPEA